MNFRYDKCVLFKNLSEDDIHRCLSCSGAGIHYYGKDSRIFDVLDVPSMLYVLVSGAVLIGRDHYSGRRSVLYEIRPYEIFGVSQLFGEDGAYDCYAVATEKASVLAIPKHFLYQTCSKGCAHHTRFIYNILSILATRNHVLTKKITLLSSGSLKKRISAYLLDSCDASGVVHLAMNREQLADYLNTERPSLSRELMKMQRDGLVTAGRKEIIIDNMDELNRILDE